MSLSITQKAFIVVLTISAILVAMTFWLVFAGIGSGLESYAKEREIALLKPAVEFLESNYKRHNGWQFATETPMRLHHELAMCFENKSLEAGPARHKPPPPAPDQLHMNPEGFSRPPRISRYIQNLLSRVCLFDNSRKQIFGPENSNIGMNEIVLKVDSKPIGYLNLVDVPMNVRGLEESFVDNLRNNIFTIAGSILLFSTLAAVLLLRGVIRPLKQIEDGINKISDGDFAVKVDLDRKDELGKLADNVNQLAVSLNKHNQSRMQWMADTSHELRTPIAILRAQIEAFQDGVQEVTPKTLSVIHSEIMGLNKLVDQLYDISRADLGRLSLRFTSFNPLILIAECIESFENRYEEKNISIEFESLENEIAEVQCDTDMLKRLFSNLMENSLRYTDNGGKLKISAELNQNKLYIRFDDSNPGVPDEHYDKLFERFYRVDSSRSRQLGGTGLGLSISKHIVESHGGGITASKSPLGGLRMEIWLPAEKSREGKR